MKLLRKTNDLQKVFAQNSRMVGNSYLPLDCKLAGNSNFACTVYYAFLVP